jgi:hypothetical protein
VLILGTFAVLLLIGGILVATMTTAFSVSKNSFAHVVSIAVSIVAISASLFIVGGAVSALFNTPQKLSEKIIKEVSSSSVRSKLGFMATVKNELYRLGKLLSDPSDVPNVWDYLLPDWLQGFKPKLKKFMISIFGGNVVRGLRPCKLIIFVDDLDRCQPEKIVEMLQALVLLTEDTPFIVFLAADPRIIVRAVESANSNFFSEAGISGYEYLDKIVHIPFAIPSLVQREKSNLVAGYMLGNPTIPNDFVIQAHNAGRSDDTTLIIKFNSNGSHVLTSSTDGTFKVWDACTGNFGHVFYGACEIPFIGRGLTNWEGAIWSSDDSKIYAATLPVNDDFESIKVFDSVTGDILQRTSRLDGINSFAISPDKSKLCVAINTSTNILVFKGDDLKTKLYDYRKHRNICNVIRFSPNGSEISSADKNNEIHVWNAYNGNQLHVLNLGLFRQWYIPTLEYHPDGSTIVVGGLMRYAVLDTRNGKLVKLIETDKYFELPASNSPQDSHYFVKSISFNQDGMMLAATLGRSTIVNVFKTFTGELMYQFSEGEVFLTSVSWSPDGKRIAYGDRNGKVYFRKLSNMRRVHL